MTYTVSPGFIVSAAFWRVFHADDVDVPELPSLPLVAT